MKKPQINVIKPDIKNVSIYLRSTKKFGKSTLFRDVILEKYGDPAKGLLVACGHEVGYKFLDNINCVHATSWKDLKELKKWLIEEKGKEHEIEIIAFDTVDEFALLADTETIRLSNIENPKKQVKSIKAAFGGYTAGEKYSANNLIKPYMNDLQEAGFGLWAIAHTKFKTIKEKGGLDEDGYMQLSSNLSADYESAFGDIFDVTLTGVIDRNIEEIEDGDKKKRRATETVRKLYFRETPLIDAGGRFAFGAVPEYMIFDKPNMAKEFIEIVENGMEKSKLNLGKKPVVKKKIEEPTPTEEEIEEMIEDQEEMIAAESGENFEEEVSVDDLRAKVREVLKTISTEKKVLVRKFIGTYGKLADVDKDGLEEILSMCED